ncbi:MAG: T9SS type A sorting domain-containing protein [Bacteroidia bacterium]
MKKSLLSAVLLGLLLIGDSSAFAQVSTTTLQDNAKIQNFLAKNPNYSFQNINKNKFGQKDTLNLPFFDDFSESSLYPDSSKWLNNQVYINNQFPIEPPTYNVATFDALASNGRPYNTTINKDFNGPGDSLISQPINLKDSMGTPYALTDSIVLSFFFQPNGNGYHLNGEDSLRLFFKAENQVWIQVWSVGGQGENAPFQHVSLAIEDINYLHKDFQFMFTTYTRQVGNANHWHLDYVYLDSRRSTSTDYYNDYAIQTTPTSLLKEYSSMPYSHYSTNPASFNEDAVYFRASNLYNVAKNIEVRHEAYYKGTDEKANTKFSENSNNILAQSSILRNLPKYDISGLTGTDPIVIDRMIEIRENGIVNDYKNNDKITTTQVFYDYYAYDDGSAERGFGFDHNTSPSNIEGQVAYGFDIAKEDTLYAVATFFNEAVYDVSRTRFKYRIWKDLSGVDGASEDVLIYESDDESPSYNTANGERTFSTHYIDTLLLLSPGKYYIGWWQQSMFNLNVGWDMNYGNLKNSDRPNPNLYYNTFGTWKNSDLPNGTLMMRPHFGSKRQLYASIHQVEADEYNHRIYPNPARNIVKFGKEYAKVSLSTMSGLIVKSDLDVKSLELNGLQAGLYFVTLEDEKGQIHTSKLVIIAD